MSIKKDSLLSIAETSAIRYGEYVVENRALADMRDGLKPVQRRILWSMYLNGLTYDKGFRKSAFTVGDVMGSFHPHGDKAIYDAMVNMANMPEKLLEPQGNFGGFAGPAAAMRYTECKLSKYSCMMMLHPDYLELMPKVSNFDSTRQEPLYLPSLLPALLINGSSGIGYAVSANIPPHTVASVAQLVIKGLDGPLTVKDCAKTLKLNYANKPKLLSSAQDLVQMYKDGNGSLSFQCHYKVDGKMMIITSGTPHFNVTGKIDKIAQDTDVSNVLDRSGDSLSIEITFKRGVDATKAAARIAKQYLVESQSYNFGLTLRYKKKLQDGLSEGKADFRNVGVLDFFHIWIKWRIDLERQVIALYIKRAEAELHKQQLWLLASNKLDVIFKVLKSKPKSYDVALSKALRITLEDAKMLLDRSVRSLNALNKADIQKRINALQTEIANLRKASPKDRIKKQLQEFEA